VLADLLTAVGARSNYSLASEVFGALAAAHPEFAGMSYDALALKGEAIAGADAAAGATA
jgi:predicted molibdopterin-dependent oxidoreductase YjgC